MPLKYHCLIRSQIPLIFSHYTSALLLLLLLTVKFLPMLPGQGSVSSISSGNKNGPVVTTAMVHWDKGLAELPASMTIDDTEYGIQRRRKLMMSSRVSDGDRGVFYVDGDEMYVPNMLIALLDKGDSKESKTGNNTTAPLRLNSLYPTQQLNVNVFSYSTNSTHCNDSPRPKRSSNLSTPLSITTPLTTTTLLTLTLLTLTSLF